MSIQRVRPEEVKKELAKHGARVHIVQGPNFQGRQEAIGQGPADQEHAVDVSQVEIDPWRGPRQYMNDGTFKYPRGWAGMTNTMKEVVLQQTARRNKGIKEQFEVFVKKHFAKIEEAKVRVEIEEVDKILEAESKAELTKALESLNEAKEAPELDLEGALELQAVLLDSFSNPDFQQRRAFIVKEYARNDTRLNSERHSLIASVYSKVLPMYGFSKTYKGVYDMQQVFRKAAWAENEVVKSNQARINTLLYELGDQLPPELQTRLQEEEKEAEDEEEEEVAPEGAAMKPAGEAGPQEMVGSAAAERPAYCCPAAEPRCAKELKKPLHQWKLVTYEQLNEQHDKKAPGIYYGLEFPFNADMLKDMGKTWLTKAFREAETIPEDETVTRISNVKNFVKGGAGSKFTFEVEYRSKAASLHTRLFAKIPFPMTQQTRSDRMAMSINQQGQECQEISTYRLLESRFPFRIPRYYFGDISNLTTNFILITEAIPYGQKDGDVMVENAYHKMRDKELAGPAEDYYYLLIRIGAHLAAVYKKAALAPFELLDQVFGNSAMRVPDQWGMGPHNTGLKDNEFKMKIEMGADFVSSIAKVLFPPECTTPEAVTKYRRVLSKLNSYTAEARYWCNRDPDYIAWTHINLNVDNVFFWRDAEGKLDAGILDWGGVTCDGVGSKLWWWLYCCEYDFLTAHIDGLLQYFVDVYSQHCGISLSAGELKLHFILAALLQGIGVLGAVPMIYRMCPKKEWKTIQHREDPRIFADVQGTGNLRVYIGTFINIVRMIKDWGIEEILDKWIDEFTGLSGIPKKEFYKPE